jgi:hypothetical protein
MFAAVSALFLSRTSSSIRFHLRHLPVLRPARKARQRDREDARIGIRFAASFITVLAMNVSIVETAAAQSRPDTTRMSCAAARALVMRQGAIVLGTGRSRFDSNAPPLFDRYVNSQVYCMRDEVTEPAFVPTADNLRCFIGYICRQPRYDIH